MRRGAAIAAATGVALIAGAGSANAALYCVDSPGADCDEMVTGPGGLQGVLDKAETTATNDVVRVGPLSYAGNFAYDPSIDAGTLRIVGAGADKTTLVPPAPPSGTVLRLERDTIGHAADAAGFAVVLPVPVGSLTGISTEGDVEDVRMTATAGGAGSTIGAILRGTGSALRRSVLQMNNANQAIAVYVDGGSGVTNETEPATVEESSLLNGLVTFQAFAPARIRRSRVSCRGNRAVIARGTNVTVDDSVIEADNCSGLSAMPEASGAGTLLARHATVVSVGSTPAFAGLDVTADTASDPNASLDVRHSIIRGFASTMFRRAAATRSATVTISASNFPRGNDLVQGAGNTSVFEPVGNIDADPLFNGPGDYTLRVGSPSIDAVFSPPLAPDEPLVDFAGQARIQDGNGDGVAARDMGAFEHSTVPLSQQPGQPQPAPGDIVRPVIESASMSRTTFAVARGSTPLAAQRRRRVPRGSAFRYTLSESAKVTIAIERKLAGRRVGKRCKKPSRKLNSRERCDRYVSKGTLRRTAPTGRSTVAFTGRLGRRALAAGSYRARIKAVDAAGNVSAERRLGFRIVRH